MHIQVNGKQIDVGEALRGHVEDRFVAAVGKYAENPIDSTVTFSRDRHEIVCDATAHLSTGMVAKAKGKATDPYAAAESACDRLEKQLRRYKRRLKDHHKERPSPIPALEATGYVLQGAAEDAHHDEDWEEPASLDPMIIAEMRHPVQHLTVGEAVMAMEMADEPFLLFKNNSHGGINVVFRRPDGNIGWIDPANLPEG
ncbi:MAG: ribosome hibernation-promoting factor, HPF/YfiA family [Albimonas sp.]|uniref:ribosome hibernation-promoting factor, HPF/YfiA family n=1 Tax=Albimonas sp. TaxID=1872425 RepID=UPI00405626BD|tara:strand:+ start:276 stop:872 length:597 start_codon:yes stop_codon:yes gene_type:complete